MKLMNILRYAWNAIRLQYSGKAFTRGHEIYLFLFAQFARRHHVGAKRPIIFHPQVLGDTSVSCRLGTMDVGVLSEMLSEQYYLCDAVKDPAVILDLGANVGLVSAHFAALYPRARIFAVEADEENFHQFLLNTIKWRHRVTIDRAAIWSHNGTVSLSGIDEVGFRASEPSAISGDEIQLREKDCPAITIDSLLDQHQIEHVDYMKMDIEGAEYKVFLETDCAWASKVSLIKLEYHMGRYEELVNRLSGLGFLCKKDSKHWSTIIAVSKNIRHV